MKAVKKNPLPDLEYVKHSLRVEHKEDDDLITEMIQAALDVCVFYTGKSYIGTANKYNGFAIVNMPDRVRMGILLYVGLLYEQRSFVSDKQLREVPQTVARLWGSARDVGIY